MNVTEGNLAGSKIVFSERSLYIYRYIAYTVKRLGKSENCDYVLKRWNQLGVTTLLRVPERDSRDKLHYHGIIRVPKNMLYQRLQVRGYHIFTQEVSNYRDYKKWLKYCNKELNEEINSPDAALSEAKG